MRTLACVAILLGGVVAAVRPVGAQTASVSARTVYRLNADSAFEHGCFPPCLCPVLIGTPVKGTFVLTPTGFDGLFTTYAVSEVNWVVSTRRHRHDGHR